MSGVQREPPKGEGGEPRHRTGRLPPSTHLLYEQEHESLGMDHFPTERIDRCTCRSRFGLEEKGVGVILSMGASRAPMVKVTCPPLPTAACRTTGLAEHALAGQRFGPFGQFLRHDELLKQVHRLLAEDAQLLWAEGSKDA